MGACRMDAGTHIALVIDEDGRLCADMRVRSDDEIYAAVRHLRACHGGNARIIVDGVELEAEGIRPW